MGEKPQPQQPECPEKMLLHGEIPNGRTIIPLVISLIMVSMIGMVGLLINSFITLDVQAQLNLKKRVIGALHLEFDRLEQALLEYSYWDEAYENLVLTQSVDFIDDNITAFLFETYGTHVTLVMNGKQEPLVTHVNGEPDEFSQQQVQALGITDLAVHTASMEEYPFIVTAYRRYQGEPYLVAVGAFINGETELPYEDGAALVFAKRLDKQYIDYIAEQYQLPGLRLTSPEHRQYPAKHVLTGVNGQLMGQLWWQQEDTAYSHLLDILPVTVLVFMVLLGIAWLLLRREHNNRAHYTNQLFEMASKDFLTGISNRREFFQLAHRELNRSKRDGQPLCMLMMDIDHFKKINDSLGHESGDKVLTGFTGIVQKKLREIDILARMGGEEFCALLVATDQQKAQEVAERVRQAVSDYPFPELGPHSVQCTVSMALGVWDGEESLDHFLNRVDKALYAAKHKGRNQVCIAQSC